MRICIVKQPYISNLAWESTRYASPQQTLDAFVYRSQNISFVIGMKVDIWVVEGMAMQPPSFRRKMDPDGIRMMYEAQKAVSWDTIPWDDYDIVISWDPIISDKIIEKHPHTLWIYCEPEYRSGRAKKATYGSPAGRYDLFWDFSMRARSQLHSLPQSISFPYFAHPDIMRELVIPLNEPAVWIDSRHSSYASPSEREGMKREFPGICNLPIRFAPVKGQLLMRRGGPTDRQFLATNKMLHCREFLGHLGSCKYFLIWRKRAIIGQASIEAAALGLIVIANSNGIFHKMLCHPRCLIPPGGPARVGLRLIKRIEKDRVLQQEILAYQDEMLREKFWKQPLGTLHKALMMKRENIID